MVLGALVVSFVLNGFSASRAEAWVSWHAAHRSLQGSPATCSDTAWLQRATPVAAAAANELKPENGISYFAANTIDGSDETAWAQEYPNPDGLASISWTLAARRSLRLACVEVGYAKNYVSFERNERLQSARFTFPGTSCSAVTVTFPDLLGEMRSGPGYTYTDPTAVPPKCKTTMLRMTVLSTYPASDGSHDLAVSGIALYGS